MAIGTRFRSNLVKSTEVEMCKAYYELVTRDINSWLEFQFMFTKKRYEVQFDYKTLKANVTSHKSYKLIKSS